MGARFLGDKTNGRRYDTDEIAALTSSVKVKDNVYDGKLCHVIWKTWEF